MVLGLLLPALALEVLLRLLGPFLPGDYQTAIFTIPSEAVGHRNNPNTAGWVRGPDYATWVRVNSQGLRGPEVAYAKAPGTYRILVLGDSFTFAHQVPEEETFVAHLAARLREAHPSRQFETINAGTNGWSTANEYVWLATEGYRYAPDLVVLMFYTGNDPAGNAKHVGTPERVDDLQFAAEGSAPLRDLRQYLANVSATWAFVERGVLAKLRSADGAEPSETPAAEALLDSPEVHQQVSSLDSEEKVRGWAISERLIARMRDFCAAHQMRLVVVSIPAYGLVTDSRRRASPLEAISERHGLELIDLLDPFRAEPRRQRRKLYLENDFHWTAEGNAAAARVVAAELSDRQFNLAPVLAPISLHASPSPFAVAR